MPNGPLEVGDGLGEGVSGDADVEGLGSALTEAAGALDVHAAAHRVRDASAAANEER